MDPTLVQIINELLLAQADARRLRGSLEALQAVHAECPKPEPVDAATAAGGHAERAESTAP